LEGTDIVHTVPGVDMHMYNSFPSGHSATVFSLFFMLSLALSGKKPVLGIVFFVLALLGSYSRIYLGQHFPEDVLAGSVTGVVITYLCYKLIDKLLKDKDWATQALFKKGKAHE
jgi:membrane-associated phospholipid phosphatase